MTPNQPGSTAVPAPADYSHTLYHNDLSALPLGDLVLPDPAIAEHCALPSAELSGGLRVPFVHPSWRATGAFKVIERGVNRFIATMGASPHCEERMLVTGSSDWSNYRVRAVVTPLNFDGAGPGGGICGLVARYRDRNNFIALVLDRDFQAKLLQRRDGEWLLLDARPVEFCLGQSLTLTLTLEGPRIHGVAGPYTGAAHLYGYMGGSAVTVGNEVWAGGPKGGKALALPVEPPARENYQGCIGFIADVSARCGTLTVECSPEEAAALEGLATKRAAALQSRRKNVPGMKLLRTVPLQGLVSGPNLRLADVNGDGKPELILAQHSPKVAGGASMTRLTCLTVMDLDGKILWQAGEPDKDAPAFGDDLPAQVFDLYHDGHGVVVCVFGFDIQIRDGKTGRVLNSAATPDMTHWMVPQEYRDAAATFGRPMADERENLNVIRLASAKIMGNGNPDDILVMGQFHHLVALDGINLKPLFKHRGNHGRYPLVLDLDGDGRDEIVAGSVILDDTGKTLGALAAGGVPNASMVVRAQAGEDAPRVWVIGGRDGLAFVPLSGLGLDAEAAASLRFSGAPVEKLACARLRSDLPGLQFVASGAGVLRLYDAGGRRVWAREGDASALLPVNWTGAETELILLSMLPGSGLMNGAGEIVVEAPASGPRACCRVSREFSTDGRDAILAWDSEQLAVYVPDNATPASVYKPHRPGAANISVHAARISLPAN